MEEVYRGYTIKIAHEKDRLVYAVARGCKQLASGEALLEDEPILRLELYRLCDWYESTAEAARMR